jgi:hypothetical protein
VVDFRTLAPLPAPVQRYLRTVLRDGQPLIQDVRLCHEGEFNLGAGTDRWRPFRSEQQVVLHPPGFDWYARVVMLPGLAVRVHDAYIAGEGILRASLAGLYSPLDLADRGELARGELMRLLAESPWYPTLLLPGAGVEWEALDDRCARARLRDGDLVVMLEFGFDDGGLVQTVTAPDRGRLVDGQSLPTPWRGRFWEYAERNGVRVPLAGEVAWLLPEGPAPYWRGRLRRIEYRGRR